MYHYKNTIHFKGRLPLVLSCQKFLTSAKIMIENRYFIECCFSQACALDYLQLLILYCYVLILLLITETVSVTDEKKKKTFLEMTDS